MTPQRYGIYKGSYWIGVSEKYTENINQLKRFSASMPHLMREHFNVTHVHNIFSFNHWLQMIRKPYIVFYKGFDASGESKK